MLRMFLWIIGRRKIRRKCSEVTVWRIPMATWERFITRSKTTVDSKQSSGLPCQTVFTTKSCGTTSLGRLIDTHNYSPVFSEVFTQSRSKKVIEVLTMFEKTINVHLTAENSIHFDIKKFHWTFSEAITKRFSMSSVHDAAAFSNVLDKCRESRLMQCE
jgi:hypothetical protein